LLSIFEDPFLTGNIVHKHGRSDFQVKVRRVSIWKHRNRGFHGKKFEMDTTRLQPVECQFLPIQGLPESGETPLTLVSGASILAYQLLVNSLGGN